MAHNLQPNDANRVMAKVEAGLDGLKGSMAVGRANRKLGFGIAAALVTAVSCAPATSASAADDGGVGAFFRNALGIGAEPQPAPSYDPSYDLPQDRPVIVRPRHNRSASRRPVVKIAVGPVAPVSIYEDRTLRAGDAVMTKTGVRVFMGGHSLPYSEADFAALSDADGLSKPVEKALLVINKAPRG